jgi:hypothetical protein
MAEKLSAWWRTILVAAALRCLLVAHPIITYAVRSVLAVPEFSQRPYDSIYWATTAFMIIAYFRNDNVDRDVEIARREHGNNFNQGGTLEDIEYYVQDYTGRNGSIQYNALSYAAVQYQINNRGPIGTAIYWTSGGGHAMVIKGYDTSTSFVIYNDPWDGRGHGCTYSYYVSNSNWRWGGSLFYQ